MKSITALIHCICTALPVFVPVFCRLTWAGTRTYKLEDQCAHLQGILTERPRVDPYEL